MMTKEEKKWVLKNLAPKDSKANLDVWLAGFESGMQYVYKKQEENKGWTRTESEEWDDFKNGLSFGMK